MPRGGARPGAGAKPGITSERQKKKMINAVARVAKKAGKTPEDIQAEILVLGKFFGKEITVRDWNTTYSIYLDKLVIKSSHRTSEEHTYEHGFIILPEIKRPTEDEMPKA